VAPVSYQVEDTVKKHCPQYDRPEAIAFLDALSPATGSAEGFFYFRRWMMPCDYKQYPDNWKWLSKQAIADAGNRCELCYAPNGVTVNRKKDGQYPWELAHQGGGKDTKIILTVHHINHDKKDSTKQNLIALCQRCHLRLDLVHHMKNRARSRKEKNQTSLFGGE